MMARASTHKWANGNCTKNTVYTAEKGKAECKTADIPLPLLI